MVNPYHEPAPKRAWTKQVAWNKKMATLLKGEGGIKMHPAPDYSAPHTNWVLAGRDGRTNMWQKEMMTLLTKQPKSMKGFTFMPKGEVT